MYNLLIIIHRVNVLTVTGYLRDRASTIAAIDNGNKTSTDVAEKK